MQIFDFLTNQLSTNSFLSGGAILASVGIVLAYLRSAPGFIYRWFKRRIITEVDIPDRDESFKWLNVWLSQHPYKKRCRWWTVTTKRKRDYDEPASIDSSMPRIVLSPAPGIHFLWYKKRFMILGRDRKDSSDKNNPGLFGFRETFNIKLFSRNQQLVHDLLKEAQEAAYPKEKERIRILRPDYTEWIEVGKRMLRPLDSVILDGNISETLLTDIQQFFSSEQWYNDHGIPYRRGYLLHGPPGNGKSSIITALASYLRCDICVLNLSNSSLTDERLVELLANIPVNSLVLIEDVDCIFKERTKVDEKESVTFSGLLNAIDGVLASEGRLLFLTTNYKETLDSALIRPGRIDLDILIDNASLKQAKQMFLRFFPESKLADEFSAKAKGFSMAQIQGHLLTYRNSDLAAVTNKIEGGKHEC